MSGALHYHFKNIVYVTIGYIVSMMVGNLKMNGSQPYQLCQPGELRTGRS